MGKVTDRNLLFHRWARRYRSVGITTRKKLLRCCVTEDSPLGPPPRRPKGRILPDNSLRSVMGSRIGGSRRQNGGIKPSATFRLCRCARPDSDLLETSSKAGSSHDWLRDWRRVPGGRLLPQSAMPQNWLSKPCESVPEVRRALRALQFFDHLALMPFDEADDFHFRPASRTD